MTRILIVETASPKRVRLKAEQILSGGSHPSPELTILCTDDLSTARFLQEVGEAEVIPLWYFQKKRVLADLKRRSFDLMLVFWSGERKYRRMKKVALGMHSKEVEVDSGDGCTFRLTWKAWIRHSIFRLRHPLPSDHWHFVVPEPAPAPYPGGEKVLIVQSAESQYVLRALENLRERPLFRNPHYYLFCRNRPEIVSRFEGHPMLYRLITHSETRGTWGHLRAFRRERFDGLVLFLTGDPSYWKIKYFAFLLGARLKLVYNENIDCFYFSLRKWLPLLAHRMGQRTEAGQQRWTQQLGILLSLAVKILAFPFRFAWLLLVWVRLRRAVLKASR